MGVIDSIGGWIFDQASTAKSYIDKTYYAVTNSKDFNTVSNTLSNFVEQTEDGVTFLVNTVTGEKLTGDAADKMRTAILKAKGVPPDNTIDISLGSVEPEGYSKSPLYDKTWDSESYKEETPGKANSGMGADSNATVIPGKKDVPFSAFNRWSLLNYVGGPLDTISKDDYNKPLNAGQDNDIFRNPTASKIIQTLSEKDNPGYTYAYSDFALAKYYGKISNNFMITLRRFPMPVEDNIINPKVVGPDGTVVDNAMADLARAVTWMDETVGNSLSDILKFDVSTSWKKVESEIQEMQGGSAGGGGMLGGMIQGNAFARAAIGASRGMDHNAVNNANTGYDSMKSTYPNHIFGPINIIKEVMVREAGLNYNGDLSLKFHYNLRQLEGVSPKIAFLDLLSNLLVLTYNNGNFWGGASRYVGGGGKAFSQPFGDFAKLQSGDFGGFLGSIVGDITKMAGNVLGDIGENGLMGSKLGKNLIGGGLMDLFGTPQGGEAVKAFLTGDATGQYHVTIGNPLAPIAVMGNMYCEKADFQFGGELSYEGFPTELTLTVTLKPARPRDKADIERMFNGGRERMYLTPDGGVDTNSNTTTSAYGNKDSKQHVDIYRKMTGG